MGPSDNITWEDGTAVNWTNWHGEDLNRTGEDPACVAAMTSPPYSWTMASCNQTLPSLCEIFKGLWPLFIYSFAPNSGEESLFGVRNIPVLPQWHVKDLGHSAKRWQVTPKTRVHPSPHEVGVGWLCRCPGVVWELIRKRVPRN